MAKKKAGQTIGELLGPVENQALATKLLDFVQTHSLYDVEQHIIHQTIPPDLLDAFDAVVRAHVAAQDAGKDSHNG